MNTLHYENLAGTLVRRDGVLSWRCVGCGTSGTSKQVLKRCPECVPKRSGRLGVRMPKSLHTRLALEAEAEGVSLNAWVVSLLSRGES